MPRSGFTLVELLITIAILGLILALAIPRFHSPSRDTTTFGLQLASLLNNAASKAKNQQTSICVRQEDTRYTLVLGGYIDEHTLEIPSDVTPQEHAPICYDPFGHLIGPARTLRLSHPAGEDTVLTIDAAYGNARVSR